MTIGLLTNNDRHYHIIRKHNELFTKVMEMIKYADARSNYELGSMSLSEDHNRVVRRPAHIVIPIAPESKWSTNIETGFT